MKKDGGGVLIKRACEPVIEKKAPCLLFQELFVLVELYYIAQHKRRTNRKEEEEMKMDRQTRFIDILRPNKATGWR